MEPCASECALPSAAVHIVLHETFAATWGCLSGRGWAGYDILFVTLRHDIKIALLVIFGSHVLQGRDLDM